MIEPRYFVWSLDPATIPYRIYGKRNYNAPSENDPRCIWRGDDLSSARAECRLANMKRPKKSETQKRVKIFDDNGRIKNARVLEEAGQERLF